MQRRKWLIVSLVGVSIISALSEGIFYLRGVLSPSATSDFAGILMGFLIALWIDADSKDHPQVGRSFDYGFLVLMYWMPYLPYYLWRTRGPAGLFIFAGFIGLWLMGFLVQLLIYGWYYL